MMTTYLVKPGELILKGGNRKLFVKTLIRNLSAQLKGTGAQIVTGSGRYYVHCPPETEQKAEEALDCLIGISGWAKTRTTDKKIDDILAACVAEGKLLYDRGIKSFKIEARRTDKSFPLDSYQINCLAGAAVQKEIPQLKVDVHKPDAVIEVEIREKVYIFGNNIEGRRGLPVGTAGKGLLLLSGGIDSLPLE